MPQARTLDIIVTGTGRSGTGFASKWLTSIGIPTGHESFFTPGGLEMALRLLRHRLSFLRGESSWLAAPYLDSQPLRGALVIHQVRHPKQMIESCLRKPTSQAPAYAEYMENHLPQMGRYEDELNKMACQWIWWNQMIEEAIEDREAYFWRVEDGTDGLLQWLEGHGLVDTSRLYPAQLFSNTRYNHKVGPAKTAHLEEIRPDLIQPLREQMQRYGYLEWGENDGENCNSN
jgi:hypothetical protein